MNPDQSKTVNLSKTLTISRVMGGLWQIADMERQNKTVDLEKTADAMHYYVEKGITTFDMADHYGSAELIAGSYHHKYGKQQAQFLTKWVPEPGPCHKQDVRLAVTRSLDRMQTECIDLLQFHAWNYADPSWLDCLYWLQELKTEGLINNLGVTNFDAPHLRVALASGIQLVSNQVCYSILDQRAAGAMTALCKEFDVKILAFGVLAGGFLTNKWLDQPEPNKLDTWSQMKYKRFIDTAGGWARFQQVLTVLNDLAQKKNCSIASIAIRFILENPTVGGAIVGARLGERDHVDANLQVFDMIFAEDELTKIQQVVTKLQPIPGDCGDEYRTPPYLTASGDLSHHIIEMPAPYDVFEKKAKKHVVSGTIWESMAGFSRAVMTGNVIRVSGTTATHKELAIGMQDPIAQTHFIIDKIEGALQTLRASLKDVVRTRVYIKHLDHWEAVAKVHGQRFSEAQPANTMIRADLVGDYLVEIEAEAVVGAED